MEPSKQNNLFQNSKYRETCLLFCSQGLDQEEVLMIKQIWVQATMAQVYDSASRGKAGGAKV